MDFDFGWLTFGDFGNGGVSFLIILIARNEAIAKTSDATTVFEIAASEDLLAMTKYYFCF